MGKPNLLVPMAGLGTRFIKKGFSIPKQLINIKDKHLIDISLDCLVLDDVQLTFVVRDEHVYNFRIDEILRKKFGESINIVILEHETQDVVETCLHAKKFINNKEALIIHLLNMEFSPQFNPHELDNYDADGCILTFKSNSRNHSYVKHVGELVVETSEKKLISDDACAGIYGFKHGSYFCEMAEQMLEHHNRIENKFCMTTLYNSFIESGKKVKIVELDKIHFFRSPEEFEFYKTNVIKHIGEKPIALCSDHSGYEAKELMKQILNSNKLKYIDYGTIINRDCNYKDYISQATKAILEGNCDFAFGFCRSGQGVNICANKFKGIRSALIYDAYSMEMAIRHNCANFFAIPARHFNKNNGKIYLDIALKHTFDGGRHESRIQEIE